MRGQHWGVNRGLENEPEEGPVKKPKEIVPFGLIPEHAFSIPSKEKRPGV